MKTLKLLFTIIIAILCNYTLYARNDGSLGFSIKRVTIIDDSDGSSYHLCIVNDILRNGPAHKANIDETQKMILFIDTLSMLVPYDSMDRNSYYEYVLSKLKKDAGEMVNLTLSLSSEMLPKDEYGSLHIKDRNFLLTSYTKVYNLKAEQKEIIEKEWAQYLNSWDMAYHGYSWDDKNTMVKTTKQGCLHNPKFKDDFARYVDDFVIIVDSLVIQEDRYKISIALLKSELQKKGYNVYVMEKSKNRFHLNNEAVLFDGYSLSQLKNRACIVFGSRIDKNTDNYSADISKEYAKYVDNHGNSITEYRPEKTRWTITNYEMSGFLSVSLPRRVYHGYSYDMRLKDVLVKRFHIKTKKDNYMESALKSILKEIPNAQ